mmetsp:Transcript_35365/g.113670  ORF Transcript_35365/g.113670 Transcript_35365/m.113670 type:complete len:298 (-) Transcript_35365:10-903(-)
MLLQLADVGLELCRVGAQVAVGRLGPLQRRLAREVLQLLLDVAVRGAQLLRLLPQLRVLRVEDECDLLLEGRGVVLAGEEEGVCAREVVDEHRVPVIRVEVAVGLPLGDRLVVLEQVDEPREDGEQLRPGGWVSDGGEGGAANRGRVGEELEHARDLVLELADELEVGVDVGEHEGDDSEKVLGRRRRQDLARDGAVVAVLAEVDDQLADRLGHVRLVAQRPRVLHLPRALWHHARAPAAERHSARAAVVARHHGLPLGRHRRAAARRLPVRRRRAEPAQRRARRGERGAAHSHPLK